MRPLMRMQIEEKPPYQGPSASPTLYEQCIGSLTSHRIYCIKIRKGCESGVHGLSYLSENT